MDQDTAGPGGPADDAILLATPDAPAYTYALALIALTVAAVFALDAAHAPGFVMVFGLFVLLGECTSWRRNGIRATAHALHLPRLLATEAPREISRATVHAVRIVPADWLGAQDVAVRLFRANGEPLLTLTDGPTAGAARTVRVVDAPAAYAVLAALWPEAAATDSEPVASAPQPRRLSTSWNVVLMVLLLGIAVLCYGGIFGSSTVALVIVGALLVHELGHVLALRVCGVRPRGLYFVPPMGAFVSWDQTIVQSRHAATLRAFVALAGPLVGGGLALVLWYGTRLDHRLLYDFAIVSIYLNLLQLVPASPLDGAQVVASTLGHAGRWRRLLARLVLLGGLITALVLIEERLFRLLFAVAFVAAMKRFDAAGDHEAMLAKVAGSRPEFAELEAGARTAFGRQGPPSWRCPMPVGLAGAFLITHVALAAALGHALQADLEIARYWHDNGRQKSQGPVVDGDWHGQWRFWNPDGARRAEGVYAAGVPSGVWRNRDDSGAETTTDFAELPIVAVGAHFRMRCSAGLDGVAGDALQAAEATWPVLTQWLDLPEPGPQRLDILVLRNRDDYQQLARWVGGAAFVDRTCFMGFETRDAYSWLVPASEDAVMARCSTPRQTLRSVVDMAVYQTLTATVPAHAYLPAWWRDGLIGACEVRVLGRAAPGSPTAAAAAAVPYTATSIGRVQGLLARDELPSLTAIVHGGAPDDAAADFAVHWLAFEFVADAVVRDTLRHLSAELRRVDPTMGDPEQALRAAVEGTLPAATLASLDTRFREFVRALEPQWDEPYRSLEPAGDDWQQRAWPENYALAWRLPAIAATRYELRGTVELVRGRALVHLARQGTDHLSIGFTAGQDLVLWEYRTGAWRELARGRPRLVLGIPVAFVVEADGSALRVLLDGQQVLSAAPGERTLVGQWGLGVERSGAVIWSGLEVR